MRSHVLVLLQLWMGGMAPPLCCLQRNFPEVSQAGAGTYPFSAAEMVSPSAGWGGGPPPVLRQRNCWLADKQ